MSALRCTQCGMDAAEMHRIYGPGYHPALTDHYPDCCGAVAAAVAEGGDNLEWARDLLAVTA